MSSPSTEDASAEPAPNDRNAAQAVANDVGDPELALAVPDEANQGPRFPRGR